MLLSDQLRHVIRESGLSLNQIAKSAGVDQPMLSRFMSGDPQRNDIRLQRTADKLADFFGLKLVEEKTPSGAAKSSSLRRTKKKKPG
jgi:transcriptional regulator with XRE-family HTH domain